MVSYGWKGKRLTSVTGPEERPDPATRLAHDGFRAVVLSPAFACVAGAAAVRTGNYRFGSYEAMADSSSTAELADDLRAFIAGFPLSPDRFASYAASFREPANATPEEFEKLLWATLQGLHDVDEKPWDESVSADPDDAGFSFSFHGRSFFVIGMHAGSQRWTRRLGWPTLVFNAHAQFEYLREAGKFRSVQQAIRRRDSRLQGSPNPGLHEYGTESEASQYSGREVEPGWQCPFRS
jgi:FPC/CPF motif-containing protein YcgG